MITENMWLVGNSAHRGADRDRFGTFQKPEDIDRIYGQFSLALFKAYRELLRLH